MNLDDLFELARQDCPPRPGDRTVPDVMATIADEPSLAPRPLALLAAAGGAVAAAALAFAIWTAHRDADPEFALFPAIETRIL